MDRIVEHQKRVYRVGLWIVMTGSLIQVATYAMDLVPRYQTETEKRSLSQSEVPRLEIGKQVEREVFKRSKARNDAIALAQGQYFNAIVEQRGIDLVVQVTTPDDKELMDLGSPNGKQRDEPVTFISGEGGDDRIDVKSLEKSARASTYAIRVIWSSEYASRRILYQQARSNELAEAKRLNEEAARLYREGKYANAIPLAERALAIRERILPSEDSSLATSLNNLAALYRANGEPTKAEALYRRALAITENISGSESLEVSTSLNNLAVLYYTKGDYASAEPLFHRALAIREKDLGPLHSDVAMSLNNLALLYKDKGDRANAEPLYQRALAIRERVSGHWHIDVAQSLNNLASLYQSNGDYVKAEPLYERALAIYEKTHGPEHPEVATPLNNLAGLYQVKGDYTKAEPLYQRALAILEKALGPEHPSVATLSSNLAALYCAKRNYSKAEPLYQRALTIFVKVLGPKHLTVATLSNNLANLYRETANYAKAEPFYIRALAIFEELLDAEHTSIATSLNNLAALYFSRGDYTRAEPLYIRALAIFEKALGKEHPDTADSLSNIAALYRATGDYAKAVDYQSRCNDVSDRNIIRNLVSGSERQKLTYLHQTSFYMDSTISLHIQSAPNNINAKRVALGVLLQRKGRVLDAMTEGFGALRSHLSPEDQKLLKQLQDVRSQLSVLTLRGPGREGFEKHKANLKALEEREEKLQNDVSQRSAEFRAQSKIQSTPVTIEVIQQALPQDTALIEFAQYRPSDPKEAKTERRYGNPRYVAYVLPSQGEPLWAELGDAESISRKIGELRKALRDKRRQDVKRLARAVDRDVMQPVRELLGTTNRVFISPDSELNLIPFAALVDERNQYLVKRYHFTYLTSGRDLLRLQEKISSSRTSIVMADPDFDSVTITENAGDKTNSANGSDAANDSGNANVGQVRPRLGKVEFEPLKRLAASAGEAREVKKALKQAIVFLRGDATEAALKQVSRPSILHIVTHGFFLEEEVTPGSPTSQSTRIAVRRKRDESQQSVKLDNPALRSGLFFAGANKGKSGDDNGVLTALEAAGLDLWGTKLVVLSACDTGVGEVLNGEGVQGLRRALVLAGSESQMISLWPVSDPGTRELMIAYYRRLKAGEGRSAALRQVQLKMLANPKRQHPFYWASFIQSGEWANVDGKRVD